MLDQFFARLPKTVLALIAIAVGFAIMVLSDPPKTVCDSQLELFKQQQQEFLYGVEDSKKPALVKSMYSRCQDGNGPGGCFELFLRLKKMNQDLDLVPKQCGDTFADDGTLETWIFKSMKLMAQISWGDRGPASAVHRTGWFDASDLAMYCDLRRHATQIYGVEKMDEWRNGVLGSLPEAEKMSHDSVFERSLFSTSCDAYR